MKTLFFLSLIIAAALGYLTFFQDNDVDIKYNIKGYKQALTRSLDELFEQFKTSKKWLEEKKAAIKEEARLGQVNLQVYLDWLNGVRENRIRNTDRLDEEVMIDRVG